MEEEVAKSYKILASLPAYGPMYIPVTENGEGFYSQGFTVRFYKVDGTDWVANFKSGWTDFNAVQELEKTPFLLVIAGGLCYLMNPEDTRQIAVFGSDVAGLFKLADGRFILQNSIDLTIVETNGTYWQSARIAWDGLKDLTLSGDAITGFSFDSIYDEQVAVAFTYKIDNKELIGGSYQLYELTQTAKKQKFWWRFW